MIGDDLTPFFVPGEFAGSGDTLAGQPVAGIFDAAYVVAGEGIGMSSTHPAYTVAESALSGDPDGQLLVLAKDGTQYTVVGQQPDGAGVVVLVLEKA